MSTGNEKPQSAERTRITAKDYLKQRGLKNPPLDSGISGGGDIQPIRPSDVMEEWSNLNGKFRDKAISVAQSRISELEATNKRQKEALREIAALNGAVPMPAAKRIATEALKP